MSIDIYNVNEGGSRATDSYEQANPQTENRIRTVRFYFFDNDGNATSVRRDGKCYYDVKVTKSAETPENIDMKYNAVVVINTKEGDNLPKKLVAVANATPDTDKSITVAYTLPENPANISALQNSIYDLAAANADVTSIGGTEDDKDELTATSRGLVMSSSVYASSATPAVETIAATIEESNIKNSDTEAIADANAVKVYIERVNAKVRVSTDLAPAKTGTNIYDTQIDLTDAQMEALGLDKSKPAEKNIYVELPGWYVTQEATTSRLVKDINPAWTHTEDTDIFEGWNKSAWFRSFWALNPSTMSYKYHPYNESVNGNAVSSTKSNLYTQENAGDTESTGAKTSKNTEVLVLGRLMYCKGSEYLPLSYAEYNGIKYVNAGKTMTAVLLADHNVDYYIETTSEDTGPGNTTIDSKVYRKLNVSDFKVVSESFKNSGYDKTKPETLNSGSGQTRYKSYLQLDETKYPSATTTFYTISVSPATASVATGVTTTSINDVLKASDAIVNYWNGGMCYYYFDIKHLGASGEIGEYGVVRNHIYDCVIKSIKGLGTPVGDEDEVIIPEPYDNVYKYIAAQINVLSWRVVSQPVNLGQ